MTHNKEKERQMVNRTSHREALRAAAILADALNRTIGQDREELLHALLHPMGQAPRQELRRMLDEP